MKLFFENFERNRTRFGESTNGKNKFASRLAEGLRLIPGVELVKRPVDADIVLCFNKLPSVPYRLAVVRLDDVYFNRDPVQETVYKQGYSDLKTACLEADGIVFQSRLSEGMCSHHVSRVNGRVVVIPNGFPNFENTHRICEPTSTAQSAKKLLLPFERLFPQRRIEETLEILKPILDQKDWVIDVVGGTKGDMEILEKKFECGRMNFRPSVSGKKFYDLLSEADCCITLKYIDSCPNVVGEALALRTPCVISNTNGWAEHNIPGLHVANVDVSCPIKFQESSCPPTIHRGELIKTIERALFEAKPEVGEIESLAVSQIAMEYKDFFEEVINRCAEKKFGLNDYIKSYKYEIKHNLKRLKKQYDHLVK